MLTHRNAVAPEELALYPYVTRRSHEDQKTDLEIVADYISGEEVLEEG